MQFLFFFYGFIIFCAYWGYAVWLYFSSIRFNRYNSFFDLAIGFLSIFLENFKLYKKIVDTAFCFSFFFLITLWTLDWAPTDRRNWKCVYCKLFENKFISWFGNKFWFEFNFQWEINRLTLIFNDINIILYDIEKKCYFHEIWIALIE